MGTNKKDEIVTAGVVDDIQVAQVFPSSVISIADLAQIVKIIPAKTLFDT